MPLKSVPKPLNQDLADRRMDRSNFSCNWLPDNALYSAFEELNEKPAVKALLVAWYVPGETPGSLRLRTRLYSEGVNDSTALVADLFQRYTKPE
jgi:hypothetical protein